MICLYMGNSCIHNAVYDASLIHPTLLQRSNVRLNLDEQGVYSPDWATSFDLAYDFASFSVVFIQWLSLSALLLNSLAKRFSRPLVKAFSC